MGLLLSVQGSGDSAAGTAPAGRGHPLALPSALLLTAEPVPVHRTPVAAHRDPRGPRRCWPRWVPAARSPVRRPYACAAPRASAAAHGRKAERGRSARGRVRGKRDHTHFKVHLLQFFKFPVRPVPELRRWELKLYL